MDNTKYLDYREHKLTVRVYTDGTSTNVQIWRADGGGGQVFLGEGSSRRRKGDRRNPKLGQSLAVARAFAEAAGEMYLVADDLGAHSEW